MTINATNHITKNYEKEKPCPTTPRTTPNRVRRYLLPSRSTCSIFREKNLLAPLPSHRRKRPRHHWSQRPIPSFASIKNRKTNSWRVRQPAQRARLLKSLVRSFWGTYPSNPLKRIPFTFPRRTQEFLSWISAMGLVFKQDRSSKEAP